MARFPAGPVALLVISTLGMNAGIVRACPFCGAVGDSLAMKRDTADFAAVGEAEGAATAGPDGFLVQTFRIDQVLRGRPPTGTTTTIARVDGPVSGTALLFGSASGASLRWSASGANETLLGYAAAAPATSLPAAERLRWFARWLEHPEPAIAADAFMEFGLAPFEAVCGAADAFDTTRLAAWIDEPGIDSRRRGFYGLATGIVAANSIDAATRHRLSAALEAAIDAPVDDFRAGFDGLLAGLLVANGVAGLDAIERRGLFAPTARPLDQRHLLAALRFARESLAATIPHDRVAACTARLLASPAVAADAAVDLARYGAWTHIDDVARLWETLGRDDPLVRRAVAGYLAACPLPVARSYLDRLRAADPAWLDAALEAARSPLARP